MLPGLMMDYPLTLGKMDKKALRAMFADGELGPHPKPLPHEEGGGLSAAQLF